MAEVKQRHQEKAAALHGQRWDERNGHHVATAQALADAEEEYRVYADKLYDCLVGDCARVDDVINDYRKRKKEFNEDEQRTRCEECSSKAVLTPCSQCLRDVCDSCFEQIGMCNRCQADF